MSLRRAAIGLAAAVAYVGVVLAGIGPLPVRPLYDGLAPPQPYRYVNPPEEFRDENQPPASARQEVELSDLGSSAASIATDDGQAAVVLREGSIPAKAGERAASVVIEPLDPERLGPPPEGVQYDGNAYRYRVTYAASGAEATLTSPVTVVLRFPAFATALYRRAGNSWRDLGATPVAASLQVFADTPTLGVFVAAGPHATSNRAIWIAIASVTAAVAAAAAAVLARRSRQRKRRQRSRRPAKGKR